MISSLQKQSAPGPAPGRRDEQPLRVLHVAESWRPRLSGYTTRSWDLVMAQVPAGAMEPYVLVTSRQRSYGVSEVEVPPELEGRLSALPPSRLEQSLRHVRAFFVDGRHLEEKIVAACRAHSIELIHGHWSSGIGMAAARAAQTLDLPFVAEVRFDLAGAVMTETVQAPLPFLEQALRRRFERHLRHADAVVAASFSLADLLRETFPPLASRITVVPNGADCTAFQPGSKDPALLQRLALEGKFVIGSTSNMLRYEGLDLLLEALPGVQAQVPDVHVLFVGDGTQKERLQQRATEQDLPVTFAGRVPKADVAGYLRLMDLFAVPRRPAAITRYASPIKVTEAMAAGLPVVGSRVGDVPALLDEGRGVLVEPGSVNGLAQALIELAGHAQRRKAMGAQARLWAEQHLSWHDVVDLYEAVYRQAVSAHAA